MKMIDAVVKALLKEDVLPGQPANALTGYQLFAKIRSLLPTDAKEQTVLQYFSNLSKNSNSPIAKVDGSIGYYRRPVAATDASGPGTTEASSQATVAPSVVSSSTDTITEKNEEEQTAADARDLQREEKFRSIFRRYVEGYEDKYSMHVEHTAGAKKPRGLNKWKYPDVILLEWLVGMDEDNLDKSALEVKRSLGEQPFLLTSVEVKTSLAMHNARMAFFQCLSNSRWAHHAVLAVACPIESESLAEELRRLGTSYGIEVRAFNLSNEKLDQLTDASSIMSMSTKDFEEKVGSDLQVTVIVPGQKRLSLDWGYLQDMKQQSTDFDYLIKWLALCLEQRKAFSYNAARQVNEVLG